MKNKRPDHSASLATQATIRAAFFLLIALSSVLAYRIVTNGFQLETDLMSVMPHDEVYLFEQAASDKMLETGNAKLLLMLSSENDVEKYALYVKALLDDSLLFDSEKADSQWYVSSETLAKYRFGLLSDSSRKALLEKQFDKIQQNAYSSIYGLTGNLGGTLALHHDPFSLYADWHINSLTNSASKIYKDGELLWIDHSDSSRSAIIPLDLKDSVFNLSYQQQVYQLIEELIHNAPKDIKIYRSGLLFHSAKAAQQSQQEIQIVAIGSIIGIILLFLWAYRSMAQLVLSLLAIGFGCFTAFSIVHTVFNSIHILTLVFGASLIGIAIDYCLHFVAWHYQPENQSINKTAKINDILPEMLIGLATTVIASSCLWFSSLTGLQQIAAFAATGLIGSWLFVMTIFPLLPKNQPKPQSVRLSILANAGSKFWQRLGYRKTLISLLLLLITASYLLINQIELSKNARALHTPSPQLIAEERHISSTLSIHSPAYYFLVKAPTVENLLRAEEDLRNTLNKFIVTGVISGYDAVSRYWPSIQRQRENYALLSSFYNDNHAEKFMQDVGISKAAIQAHLDEFTAGSKNTLRSETWLNLNDPRVNLLWIGKVANEWASITTMQGIADISALKTLAEKNDDILFINQVERLNKLLLLQQKQALSILAIAYLVAIAIVSLRYRLTAALFIVATPLLSTMITLAVLSSFSIELSLFHCFGLFLVLGLGLDYGIFLNSPRKHESRCLAAIHLSAITSCLSFGLLSFSSTPMIQAFGLTILLGSLLNVALVPATALIISQRSGVRQQGVLKNA